MTVPNNTDDTDRNSPIDPEPDQDHLGGRHRSAEAHGRSLPQPPGPEVTGAAIERINQPARPPRPSPEVVAARRHRLQRWLVNIHTTRGLLASVGSLIMDGLDDLIAWERCEPTLDAYSRSGLEVATGIDAAEIAAVLTDWDGAA